MFGLGIRCFDLVRAYVVGYAVEGTNGGSEAGT